jgi:hypothetical protein
MVAGAIVTFGAIALDDAAAQKAPTLATDIILQPEFQTKKMTFAAGTAFLVKVDGYKRTVVLSAIHLLGPDGGYPEQVSARDVAQVIEKVTFTDKFTGEKPLSVSQGVITIPDAAPFDKGSKAGDILAFWGPENTFRKPLSLAAKGPAKGDPVWLAARVREGAPQTQQLHRATVLAEQKGQLYYEFDNAKLNIDGTSGAPVLNAAGEVVAINVGGGMDKGKLLGVGNPVGVFREHLLQGCKKSPPDKLKIGK